MVLNALELCAGGGGQALGLESAGFECSAVAEIDLACCATLRLNRPQWTVLETDIRELNGKNFRGVDLIAGGVPCPPFSIAGKQLGDEDDRDLFPEALRLISEANPSSVLLENVPGFASEKFRKYRRNLAGKLAALGYEVQWATLNACDYGVPQLRPRFLIVALRKSAARRFSFPDPPSECLQSVGAVIGDLMEERGWRGASAWRRKASGIAPTIVGGSKKHGGPDLGPTRARRQWAKLGVDGLGIADEAPSRNFPTAGMPRLTIRMVARLQGFPDEWQFAGRKTAAYRQVGNALPPPVARAVASAILRALSGRAHQSVARVQGRLFA